MAFIVFSEPNGEFEDETPTLKCIKICGSCGPRFGRACADSYSDSNEVPGGKDEVAETWETDITKPDLDPAFLRGFDDDFVLDPNLGGEG